MFPKNFGQKKYKVSGSQSKNQHIQRALETDEDNNPALVPPPRISYEEWTQTKGEIWISKPDRLCVRIADPHRRCFRQIVRAFIEQYRMGNTTGKLTSVAIVLGSVVIEVSRNPTVELKNELLEFLKPRLGENMPNPELQHFYLMIKWSTRGNFWLLEHHPLLMSIDERYRFPSDTRIALKDHGDWENQLLEFVSSIYGSAVVSFMIRPNIESHAILLNVYDNNNNNDPFKGFVDNHVGLSRFARAVFIHGLDGNRDLRPEVIEQEFSNRFPLMLTVKFQYLFQRVSATAMQNLNFLAVKGYGVEDGIL